MTLSRVIIKTLEGNSDLHLYAAALKTRHLSQGFIFSSFLFAVCVSTFSSSKRENNCILWHRQVIAAYTSRLWHSCSRWEVTFTEALQNQNVTVGIAAKLPVFWLPVRTDKRRYRRVAVEGTDALFCCTRVCNWRSVKIRNRQAPRPRHRECQDQQPDR